MRLFNHAKTGGFMDVIRCDEGSYLIWKWHPADAPAGSNNRENEIRWDSHLRVKDGEVAVFVYKQKNGLMQDYIEGPFDQTIKTSNFPVLASIYGLAFDGVSPFQAEIYFINLAKIIQTKFAVPYFDVYDPRFTDFCTPVAVHGTITFRISNYKEFIKLHRLIDFKLENLQSEIRNAVNRYIKDIVINAPAKNDIPLIQIESKIAQINDEVEYVITERFRESFGIEVSDLDISNIEIDKTSLGYKQLMEVTKDVTIATLNAEKEAKVKNIRDRQQIEIENYEETLRIQREETQYAQHKQTQSANMDAFQTEKQADVGIAGANALGQMGSNGAGDINLGGSSCSDNGVNMASIMASMTLGSVVGQNLANTMNSAMSQMNSSKMPGNTNPSNISSVCYNVAVNGQATGPYDLITLAKMIGAGEINKETLVWKSGMVNWIKAGDVPALFGLFNNGTKTGNGTEMPPIPTENK